MNFEKIVWKVDNGVALISLNRPDKLNSFDAQMAAETVQALDAAQSDASIRAVVLTGEGRAFCAGQDLAEATAPGVRIEDIVERQYNAIVRRIRNLEKPVIAAVNGVAAGAGNGCGHGKCQRHAGERRSAFHFTGTATLARDHGQYQTKLIKQ